MTLTTKVVVRQQGCPDKHVKMLEVNLAGRDGEYVWLKMITEDGETVTTGYLKEVR